MSVLAKDIMSRQLKTVPVDLPVQQFSAFLTENSISGCPVVDADQQVIGIATLSDIADFHLNEVNSNVYELLPTNEEKEARQLRESMFKDIARTPVEVGDIMSPVLIFMDQDTPVELLAQKMLEEQIHRIFIKSADDLVGIVTTIDLVRLVAGQSRPEQEPTGL